MARPTKAEKLAAVHQEALKEFDDIQAAVRDERLQCLQDRRFYSIPGAQWEGDLEEQFASKPKFEVNKVHLSVIRIINEYRNNRITVDFLPRDGSSDDALADTLDDLYRADEQDSVAQESYDNAFEEGVGGGVGAWRYRADYEDDEDDEDERQRICIEPIYDADSTVFWDLGAKRQDKSDAKRCYVLTAMTHAAYEEEYGHSPSTWPNEINQLKYDWSTPDAVYVAQLYQLEETPRTVHIWQSMDGKESRYTDEDFATDDTLRSYLEAIGSKEIRQKRVKHKRVHKYVFSGVPLEDCGYVAGPNIPIVPNYGKRWMVDGIERAMGHVRLQKDAQRLANMLRSWFGEIAGKSTVEKPILTPEQVAGHERMWSKDNVEDWPYLLINPVTDVNGQETAAPPVGYTKVPQIPPAMAALLQISEEDLKDLAGRQEQGEDLQPNISGKAVELIQSRLDMQSFIYMDNMKKAIKRGGEIWLGMAKELYVEEGRKMPGVGRDGKMRQIELARPVVNPETGEVTKENDIANAKFKVFASVGPTSESKRAATVRGVTGMAAITDDPQTKQILGAMAMMNMEGEGIDDVRTWFRQRLIAMGVIEPTEEEAEKIAEAQANAPQDPQAQYLQAAAEQATAEAEESRAATVQKIADAEKKRAEAQKVLEELDSERLRKILEVLDKMAVQQTETATLPSA